MPTYPLIQPLTMHNNINSYGKPAYAPLFNIRTTFNSTSKYHYFESQVQFEKMSAESFYRLTLHLQREPSWKAKDNFCQIMPSVSEVLNPDVNSFLFV